MKYTTGVRKANRLAFVACLAFVSLAGWRFLEVAQLALPVFDDFCRGSLFPCTELRPAVEVQGLWLSNKWSYLHWSGRWLGTLLDELALAPFDMPRTYPFLITGYVLIYAALSSLFFRPFLARYSFGATGLFWLIYGSSVPSPGEVFFLATLSVEAHMGLVLAMAGVGLSQRSGRLAKLAGLLCFVGVGGVHELAGAMTCAGLAMAVALFWRSGHPATRYWVLALVAATLGLALNMLSPGNGIRAAMMFPEHGNHWKSIPVMAIQATRFVDWLVSDPRLWGAIVFTLLHPGIGRLAAARNLGGKQWAAVLCVLGLMLAAAAIGPAWATGLEMGGRTLAQVYFVFVLGCLSAAFCGNAALRCRFTIDERLGSGLALAGLLVACGSIGLKGNAQIARLELNQGELRRWHNQQWARIQLLERARDQRLPSVHLPALSERPLLLPTVKNSLNPDYAHNLCMEAFSSAKVTSAP